MSSLIRKLKDKDLIRPPGWLPDNVMYETWMGSQSYGTAIDNSDIDVYGFCIPPKEVVFPHLKGEILGFGRQKKRFGQYQQHHIIDPSACGGKGQEYDVDVYNIVKYFQLCMDNNPNMIDSLFTPIDCVLHITNVGQMVRDSRDLFLHKGAWHRFRGYAHSQLSKMAGKTEDSKRYWMIEEYGYDVKFAMNVVRLILEVEQILAEHTIDLRRSSDVLKSIRNGEWTEQQVKDWFTNKENSLETLYNSSTLQYRPDEAAIKQLLLNCLEHHYGSLANIVYVPRKVDSLVEELDQVLSKYR